MPIYNISYKCTRTINFHGLCSGDLIKGYFSACRQPSICSLTCSVLDNKFPLTLK